MPKNLIWTHAAWEDDLFWQTQDKRTLKRINTLINAIKRDPFEGIGEPEPLRANLSGYWSRKIDHKNRLVYAVEDKTIVLIACRFHYDDT